MTEFKRFGEVGLKMEEVNAYMVAYKEEVGVTEGGIVGQVKGEVAGVKILLKSGSHFDLVGDNAILFLQCVGHE